MYIIVYTVEERRGVGVYICGIYAVCCRWDHDYGEQELCESRGGRLGLPVPNKPTVSVDVKQQWISTQSVRAQELCGRRNSRPGLPIPNSLYGLCGRKTALNLNIMFRAQELCESRGGHPELNVPNSPYGLCGRKAILNALCAVRAHTVPNMSARHLRTLSLTSSELGSCAKDEVDVLGFPWVPNSPYGLCGREATLNKELRAAPFLLQPTLAIDLAV